MLRGGGLGVVVVCVVLNGVNDELISLPAPDFGDGSESAKARFLWLVLQG